MKLPLSWLKDYVDIAVPVEEVASLLSLAGLEVEDIHYVGWAMPADGSHGFKTGPFTKANHAMVEQKLREGIDTAVANDCDGNPVTGCASAWPGPIRASASAR